MSQPSPTLKEIARKAGVSAAAVSYALRNQPGVAPATRKRILRLARQMGYRRDALVSQLMARLNRTRRKETATLAFVTNHPAFFSGMSSSKEIRGWEGAQRRAWELGYDLVEFQLSSEMDEARLSKVLWARGIEGIIIGPLQQGGTELFFDWSRFSAVAMGHSLAAPQLHTASNNQFQSMILAVTKLFRQGYRRIGVATNRDTDRRVNHAWEGGYLLACQQLEIPGPPGGFFHLDEGQAAFQKWMSSFQPDVVLAPSTFSPVRKWIEASGRRIPRDIGLAMLHLQRHDRGVTGIDQQWPGIGGLAANRLVGMIQAGEKGIPATPCTITLEGKWVPGRTTRRTGSSRGP